MDPSASIPSAGNLEADDRANELYWGSDRSVNQIADDLGLSKGALYGMIRPLAAGMGCPECGAEVAHPNRTARERGLVHCAACGWSGTEAETSRSFAPPAPRSAERAGARRRPGRRASEAPEGAAPPALLGGALLGAAAGLALLLWARRR
jgi:hypothetical protein